MDEAEFDIAVIGAGMAGASAAAELAARARVVLLEREDRPGYHSTGRSAALFTATYGPPPVRALTRASERFLTDPPPGFAAHPLLTPRGVLMIHRPDQAASAAALARDLAGGAFEPVDAAAARRLCPLLRPGHVAGGFLERGARDIDVAALHGGYLRLFAARGGRLVTRAEVTGLDRAGEGWHLVTPRGRFRARVVVNAAGAWADELARLAGVAPVGLQPMRRTAVIVAAPDGFDPAPMPAVIDIDETFYLKPDAGRLLISPADETPSPPCDAQPEELDIAICIDRIQTAFDLPIRRVAHRWAGLRSFVADRCPVIGFATDAPGFFWLAGQGGYGIQTAPAAARLAAGLLLNEGVPADIAAQGVTAAAVAPGRTAPRG